MARTAAIAGTASAVSGRVQRHHAEKFAGRAAQIYADREQAYAQQVAPAQAAPPPPRRRRLHRDPSMRRGDRAAEATRRAPCQGILTDDEFASQKARSSADQAPPGPPIESRTESRPMILADLDLGDCLVHLVFFFIVMILWIIFAIFTDLVRSDDLSGGAKALWVIFIVLLPWLAIFIYLIIRGNGMTQRSVQSHQEAQAQLNDYVRSTAGSNSSPADQIATPRRCSTAAPSARTSSISSRPGRWPDGQPA
jgi:hypothetical protein